jgi:riboflavin-specific deaminase-like protein
VKRASPTRHAKLPYVLLNLAMTADGKIATAQRAPFSFSSPRDREHMLELRATVDAVMNGARTADLNSITMGPGAAKYRRLRLRRGLQEYNLRVIVSGAGTLDPKADVFKQHFSPIVILTTQRATAQRIRALRAVADEVKVFGKSQLNFRAAFRWLRQKWNVRQLLCEGGGEIDDALFRAKLVDELHLTICPTICGGRHAPTIADGEGFQRLAQAVPLWLHSARRHGDELFLVYRTLNKTVTARRERIPRGEFRALNP